MWARGIASHSGIGPRHVWKCFAGRPPRKGDSRSRRPRQGCAAGHRQALSGDHCVLLRAGLFFPSPSSVPSPCMCSLGAGLHLQRPSCDQKGVTESHRRKFGTKRGTVIFNTGLPPVMGGLRGAGDRPGHSWVPRAQHGV